MSIEKFHFTYKEFGESMLAISDYLHSLNLAEKDIKNTELLIEESFMRWMNALNADEDFTMNVVFNKRLTSINLFLSVKGECFNPLAEIDEPLGEKSVDSIRLSILKANYDRMSFNYNDNTNTISIRIRSIKKSHKRLMVTMCSLALGIICGILIRIPLYADELQYINVTFVHPLRELILDIIKMMVAPVVFFSILSGMVSVSGTLNVGKVGKKLIIVSLSMMLANTAAAVALSLTLFHEDLSYMKTFITSSDATAPSATFSITDLFFGIIPANLVEPFQGQNILQDMALAIFFGVILIKMGNDGKPAIRVIEFINRFLMVSMQFIVKTVPFLVFISVFSLVSATGLEFFISMGKIFLGQGIGILIVVLISFISVILWTRTSPIPLLKKIIRFWPTPFAIQNDNATLPFTMQLCIEEIGIDPGLASFTVPLGIQLNKSGQCFFLSMSTAMMFCIYDIHLDTKSLILFLFMVLLMALTKPTIPGGGIIVLNYLFSVMGVPAEAISLIICIDAISVMFNIICNNTTNISSSYIVAQKENMVNLSKYRS